MADENNNMSVFTSNLINEKDIAKQFLFQIRFLYERGTVLANVLDIDDLMIKSRSASLPQKTFNELDTQYMGSKLLFPGKATVAGDFSVRFDEFQNLSVSRAMHAWQNLMFNQGFKNDIDFGNGQLTGGAASNDPRQYTATAEVLLFDSTLKNLLPYKYVIYRVWPKTLNAYGLDADAEGKITREVSFSYSTFEMVPTLGQS